ncbi:MAG: CMP-N,N'-diacetyllegionaminic acid synthase [SAR116 cluster bacterium MED-G04]|jgi:CMP-N-acetylneuraminic acid synthetase|nr:MAG: CMP-N,N'-diacetyllegionaminic acid synthase [SAR116 cluster bacterium MED-G04]|tara:strand:+ start:1413 stop:2105 length:693 start_codon:yes stop_codon:yes gene_type:complete
MKHHTVALLPMKANSERVTGKNFRDFCGKPLFRWMLDTLIAVTRIEKVVINTDARSILADHGLVEGGKIIIRDRPAEICGDHVSMNKVIADDISNVDADTYLMTHTTNPLLSGGSITKALDIYHAALDQGFDSLFTVNKVQARFYDGDANAINHDPDNMIRTQDLEPWYEENSNLYIFSAESFAKTSARIGVKPTMMESIASEACDIDTPEDWALAEIMTDHYRRTGLIG